MKRPLSENWWYIERPFPLPLILAGIILVMLLIGAAVVVIPSLVG